MQLVVLGAHRSGTSTVTGLLHAMGAYVGESWELIGQNEENPKGFFERQDVIDLNDALLRQQGCEWYDLASWNSKAINATDEQKAERMRILQDLSGMKQPWVMKDPRLCHTLPFWLDAMTQPCLLLVHRHPVAVAQSLRKRNGLPISIGLAIWEAAAVALLEYRRIYQPIELSYEALIADPKAQVSRLVQALYAKGITGLSATQDALSFIEPTLNRSGNGEPDDALLTPHQQCLWHVLQNPQDEDVPAALSQEANIQMSLGREIFPLAERGKQAEADLARAYATLR